VSIFFDFISSSSFRRGFSRKMYVWLLSMCCSFSRIMLRSYFHWLFHDAPFRLFHAISIFLSLLMCNISADDISLADGEIFSITLHFFETFSRCVIFRCAISISSLRVPIDWWRFLFISLFLRCSLRLSHAAELSLSGVSFRWFFYFISFRYADVCEMRLFLHVVLLRRCRLFILYVVKCFSAPFLRDFFYL